MTEEINDAFDSEESTEDSQEQGVNTEPPAAESKTEETKEENSDKENEDSQKESENSEEKSEVPKESKKDDTVPINALLAERRKRQELEQRIAEIEKQNIPQQEAPDPVKDPDGYKLFITQQVESDAITNRINDSRTKMISEHVDYEDKEIVYNVLRAKDPSLHEQLVKHPDPARFAYETAVKYESEQRAKIEAEILSSTKTNTVKDDPVDQNKQRAANAPDLIGATAVGRNTDNIEQDNPSDVNELFSDSPF